MPRKNQREVEFNIDIAKLFFPGAFDVLKVTRLCLHFVSGYEYCCEIDESEVPNT